MPHVHRVSDIAPHGDLHLMVRPGQKVPPAPSAITLRDIMKYGIFAFGLPDEIKRWRRLNTRNLLRGALPVLEARKLGLIHLFGSVYMTVIRGDGKILPYGLASMAVVTDTGVAFIVDAFQNLVELENMKYHGIGTGVTAEAQTQTALVTELTTEYTGNVRATGTTTEGASANIYRTVGTNTLDSGTPAVTEHGVFDQAATGGGVMTDRSVFSAINLNGTNGDGLQSTYDLTFPANG